MKIGIMSAAFPGLTFEEVVSFLSENGFGSLEAACWPSDAGKDRKYGGVVHIDVDDLTKTRIDEIQGLCKEKGIELSSLGYYANPLHDDEEHRRNVISHLKRVITGASALGIETVGTFVGRPFFLVERNWQKTLDAHFEEFMKVWPDIMKFASDKGVRIAIEHCPMLWHDTWPCGNNLPYSPAILRRCIEALGSDGFGIMYDPSHFIWQRIDYIRFLYDFSDRIFGVHAQDMALDEEMCYQHGILSSGIGIQQRRIPGMGSVNWQEVIKALYNIGYNETMNIEHEDPHWEGSVDKVKEGLTIARKHLEVFTV